MILIYTSYISGCYTNNLTKNMQYLKFGYAALASNVIAIGAKCTLDYILIVQNLKDWDFLEYCGVSVVSSLLSVTASQALPDSEKDKAFVNGGSSCISAITIYTLTDTLCGSKNLFDHPIHFGIDLLNGWICNTACDYFIENDLKDSEVDGEYGYI